MTFPNQDKEFSVFTRPNENICFRVGILNEVRSWLFGSTYFKKEYEYVDWHPEMPPDLYGHAIRHFIDSGFRLPNVDKARDFYHAVEETKDGYGSTTVYHKIDIVIKREVVGHLMIPGAKSVVRMKENFDIEYEAFFQCAPDDRYSEENRYKTEVIASDINQWIQELKELGPGGVKDKNVYVDMKHVPFCGWQKVDAIHYLDGESIETPWYENSLKHSLPVVRVIHRLHGIASEIKAENERARKMKVSKEYPYGMRWDVIPA